MTFGKKIVELALADRPADLKEAFAEGIGAVLTDLLEEQKKAIAVELSEKMNGIKRGLADGDGVPTKLAANKSSETKMQRQERVLGRPFAFKPNEMADLRKLGYIQMGDDETVLLSKDSKEGEEPTFMLSKWKSRKDGSISYMLMFNMAGASDVRKYEVFTKIEEIPHFRDAKRAWSKASNVDKVADDLTEDVEDLNEAVGGSAASRAKKSIGFGDLAKKWTPVMWNIWKETDGDYKKANAALIAYRKEHGDES